MSINTIRKILRKTFGDRQYHITAAGEIHVHGVMPNTNQTGWYLFGWLNDAQTEARINDYQ